MNESEPLVSIIIPVYNAGDNLRGLLKALLEDKYKNIEVVCVDDASHDDSAVVAQKIAQKDERLKVIENKKNVGAAEARNRGLKAASGELIMFVDGDDRIAPSMISRMVGAMKDGKYMAMCGVKQIFLRENRTEKKYADLPPARETNEGFRNYILRLMTINGRLYPAVNKIFRADIIRKNKLRFCTDMDFAEDTKFVLDYLDCVGDSELGFVTGALYYYYYGGTTSTVARSGLKWENWQRNYKDIKHWTQGAKVNQFLLIKLWWRFWVSHGLAVLRAPISYTEKRRFVSFGKFCVSKILALVLGR